MPKSWLRSRESLGRCLSIAHGNMVPAPWLPQNSPSMVTACRVSPHPAHTHQQAHTQLFTARRPTDTHARSQGAGLCPSSRPQASPPRGIRYLNNHPGELCTSAPASAPPKLFSAFHQTPSPASHDFPGCLSHPLDREEVSADLGAGRWDNRDFANSSRGTSLLPPHSVLFRDVTTVPVTPATYTERQKAARFPLGLPAGAGSAAV